LLPSTMKVTRSPFDTPSTVRTSLGMVTCPLDIILAVSIKIFFDISLHLLGIVDSRENPTCIICDNRRWVKRNNELIGDNILNYSSFQIIIIEKILSRGGRR